MSAQTNSLQQYLTFYIAGEEYAVGILDVREIIQFSPLTRMPSMPAWIRGVTNLRGKVVPVVDLAVRFGLPPTQVSKWTCIVLVETELEGERALVGLLSDAVNQVIDLGPSDIEPAPAFGTQVRADYLKGMARQEKKFALLLDLSRLLAADSVRLPDTSPALEPSAPSTAQDPPKAATSPAASSMPDASPRAG